MDSLSLFVLGWLAALLLLLGAVAWWHWFTSEPRWFMFIGALLLAGLLAGAIMTLTSAVPLWGGWAVVAVCALATIVAALAVSRGEQASRISRDQ